MPRKPKVRGARAMLNKPGFQSTAAIVAEVDNSDAIDDDTRYYGPNATLAISDCDRKVSFDFDYDTPEGRANNLHKVDTLIKVLTEFREALAIEQKVYVKKRAENKTGYW